MEFFVSNRLVKFDSRQEAQEFLDTHPQVEVDGRNAWIMAIDRASWT